MNNAHRWEDWYDATSHALIASTSLSTAGAANTAVATMDVAKFNDNTLYINSTNGPAGNAGTTGLTVFFETRPNSAASWFTFRTESGVLASGNSAFKLMGSGVASISGISHFKEIRITIQNTTDSSGTATVQAWMLSRTP